MYKLSPHTYMGLAKTGGQFRSLVLACTDVQNKLHRDQIAALIVTGELQSHASFPKEEAPFFQHQNFMKGQSPLCPGSFGTSDIPR